jgi:hypothetical protein
MGTLIAFLASPSTRTGLALIFGAISAAVTVLAAGHVTWATMSPAIGLACTGIIKILQPDNTIDIAKSVVNASATEHGDALIASTPAAPAAK